MNNHESLGIYVHIPFCRKKCPYCDFYSITPSGNIMDAYQSALFDEISSLKRLGEFVPDGISPRPVNTIYFGGGTPSLFGGERLSELIHAIKNTFHVTKNAEISVECNPSSCSPQFFQKIAEVGVNRVSIGLQSAVDEERRALGRLSGARLAKKAVLDAQKNGISNISLDLMLGVPKGGMENLKKSLDLCLSLGAKHISAYMLKIEDGTPFAKTREILDIPDEDAVCDMYIYLCDALQKNGLRQYEVSNFALPGFECAHNLKYWNATEYLGFGPAAHSFLDGRRFYFERDSYKFITGGKAVFDSYGGSVSEYTMLRLRLNGGLRENELLRRFGHGIPPETRQKAAAFEKHGLVISDAHGIRLTPKGFLLSNTITGAIMEGFRN